MERLALVSGTIHLPTSGPYTAGAGDPSANIAAPIPPCFQPASPPSCDICGDRRIASCTWYTEARSGGVNEARSCSVIHRCETQADKICSAHRPASKLAAIAVGAILLSGRQTVRDPESELARGEIQEARKGGAVWQLISGRLAFLLLACDL